MPAELSNPVRMKAHKPAHVQQGVMHGTPATRHIHSLALGGTRAAGTTRRRKKKAASSSPTRKASAPRARAARSGKAHLVKGSPAAKRHMAKLRKMKKAA